MAEGTAGAVVEGFLTLISPTIPISPAEQVSLLMLLNFSLSRCHGSTRIKGISTDPMTSWNQTCPVENREEFLAAC